MLQRVSLQMFKYSRNTLPEVTSELFITNDTFHSHNTRNKNKLRSKMSNREYMYKNFSFIGVYSSSSSSSSLLSIRLVLPLAVLLI